MSLVGFACMNPITTMAMIDTSRWRSVIYADTPRTMGLYHRYIGEKKPEQRRAVLFLLGALNLPKVLKDRARFASVFVFDDLQNLHTLTGHLDTFEIVDIKKDASGAAFPRYLSPTELGEVLDRHSALPATLPLLSQVTNALGRRRPSVLENTSRIPLPEAVPESGAQRMLSDLKSRLCEDLPFAVVLDCYTKYLFRIVARAHVTHVVTKRLPEEAKGVWKTALDFADSKVGHAMARAYHGLCTAKDADYRVSHAVGDHDLKPYAGDFLYFTSVLPPHRTCDFLAVFRDTLTAAPTPLVVAFKPKPQAVAARKSKQKKARSRA